MNVTFMTFALQGLLAATMIVLVALYAFVNLVQGDHSTGRTRLLRKRLLRVSRVVACVLIATVAIIGWRMVAPARLGGEASYGMTNGSSMLPTINPGDLVVTRQKGTYQVGDVVAYHNRQLDRTVVHRIISTSGGRFTMKGDNNLFNDAYQPSASDIIGARWMTIPGGSRYLMRMHNRVFAGVFGAFIGLLAFAGVELPSRRKPVPAA